MKRRFINLLLVVVGVACSWLAQAAYVFTNVDPPGAKSTQLWGINKSGQAVGNAATGTGDIVFLYDSKKGSFTILAPYSDSMGLLGINDSGVTVGGSDDGTVESGLIRSQMGAYTTFSHPGWENTQARGIGASGLVTGFSFDLDVDGNIVESTGFIYDPASGNFTEILPSTVINRPTIAQGINGRGDVVGSTALDAGVACASCPAGRYGFLRAPSGAFTYFKVNGLDTRPRGITDSGLIAGFVNASDGPKGFVTSLSPGPGYQSVTVPAAELLSYPSPNAVETFVQGISNLGVVSGAWTEYLGGNPKKPSNYTSHGFIATPAAPSKK